MTQHIYNIKALVGKLKKGGPKGTLYHRVNNAMKGADFAVTPEIIEELEAIISKETKTTLEFLKDLKKKAKQRAAA